jgi:hypothetical protein
MSAGRCCEPRARIDTGVFPLDYVLTISLNKLCNDWGLFMRVFTISACVTALALSGCGPTPSSEDGAKQSPQTAPKGELFSNLSTATAASCEGGGIATGDEVAVTTETDLRSTASSQAARMINEKATSATGQTIYQKLDNTEKLKEVCRQAKWSKVQVVEPDWLTDVVGWVPVSALRAIEKDSSGARVYTDSDFMWDRDTSPQKAKLVAGVNKLVRENARCPTVDTGTLSKSGNRGTAAKPVFFITCNGSSPFNVWFEPEDAANGHSFEAIQNIQNGEALLACENAAKVEANNPATVSFSKFIDAAFVPYPNGNSRLLSKFSAKNSFGVEARYRIECFFQGSSLTETRIDQDVG